MPLPLDVEPDQGGQAMSTSTLAKEGSTRKRKRGTLVSKTRTPAAKDSAQKKRGARKAEAPQPETKTVELASLDHAEKPSFTSSSAVSRVYEYNSDQSVLQWMRANPSMDLKTWPQSYKDVFDWLDNITPRRLRKNKDEQYKIGGFVDLIIANIPKRLFVLGLSIPT